MDVFINETPIGDGRYMYRVIVDGQTYDFMYSKWQLTWAQRREMAENYAEALS